MGIVSRIVDVFRSATTTDVDVRVPDTVEQSGAIDATITVGFAATGHGEPSENATRTVERVSAFVEVTSLEAESSTTMSFAEHVLVDEPFTVPLGEERQLTASIPLPTVAPPTTITNRGTTASLRCTVEFDDGSQTETASFGVEPGGPFAAIHDACTDRLGLTVERVELEQSETTGPEFADGLVAEVEYYPRGAQSAAFEELDVRLHSYDEEGLTVVLGAESEEGPEPARTMTLTDPTPAEVANQL